MRSTRVLLATLLALAAPRLAAALDAPHDASKLAGGCSTCHQLHNAIGSSLTSQVTITDACLQCHQTYGGANHRLGFPWVSGDQAVAGVSGAQHRWDAPAVNTAVGTVVPNDAQMQARIIAGKLECSVCHNQHASNKAFAPTSLHTSYAIGAANNRTNATGGTATLTLATATTAAVAKGYRVQIVSAANLAVSHDGGISWFKPSAATGGTWSADTATPVGGPFTAGTTMTLDDPALTIRLTAGAAVGDYWDFYVSYPMMRASNVAGAICLTCHQDRAQSHLDIRDGGDGVKTFSHPVGQPLNANGKGYDRAVTALLDADGGIQGASGDANASNDLNVPPTGVVGCTACHAPHNADSNSLTVDPR